MNINLRRSLELYRKEVEIKLLNDRLIFLSEIFFSLFIY